MYASCEEVPEWPRSAAARTLSGTLAAAIGAGAWAWTDGGPGAAAAVAAAVAAAGASIACWVHLNVVKRSSDGSTVAGTVKGTAPLEDS